MPKIIQGIQEGKWFRVGIVVSQFNREITQQLLTGALEALMQKGVEDTNIEVAEVPGAFEIPLGVKKMALSGNFHGIIALGAVIRGETPHFEYISSSVSSGLSHVALETGVPIGFGVLTTDTVLQAAERADPRKYNRGAHAALTVLEMVNLLRELK